MHPVTPEQALAFRLRNHHLARRIDAGSLRTAVRDVCGLQAQLGAAAHMALWARVRHLTPAEIEAALWDTRALVKVWCMRGTVHLLAAEDLSIYLGALKRSGVREVQRWMAKHGVSRGDADTMAEAVVEALAAGALTRRELTERVVALRGAKARPWIEHGWGGAVKQACLQGSICFGPNRGQEVTFVRRDQWLPDFEDMPTEEAETTLLRRYLHGYGPATPQDFAAWAGILVKDATSIWSRLGDEAVEVRVERGGLGSCVWISSRCRRKRMMPRSSICCQASIRICSGIATSSTLWTASTTRKSTGGRAGCHRSCSSTGGWRLPGLTIAPAGGCP